MGNSPSRRSSLTRELEKFSNPTGLYPKCAWDVRVVRRMVVEKKIAPRFSGRDALESCFTQECPICFMFYPGALNVVTCCSKLICTECFLQLKPPSKHDVSCPFCNRKALAIQYTEPSGLNLAVIAAETSYKNVPASSTNNREVEEDADIAVHFASAVDRQRIRDELRSELNLPERRMTTTATPPPRPMTTTRQHITRRHSELPVTRRHPPPSQRNSLNYLIDSAEEAARVASEPRYLIASATDAARLEEMMMMEAIRRSMQDVSVGVNQEEEAALSPRPTQENTAQSPQRRLSLHPFDAPLSPHRTAAPATYSSV